MKHLNKSNFVGKFPNRNIWGVTAAMCFLPVSLNWILIIKKDNFNDYKQTRITSYNRNKTKKTINVCLYLLKRVQLLLFL